MVMDVPCMLERHSPAFREEPRSCFLISYTKSFRKWDFQSLMALRFMKRNRVDMGLVATSASCGAIDCTIPGWLVSTAARFVEDLGQHQHVNASNHLLCSSKLVDPTQRCILGRIISRCTGHGVTRRSPGLPRTRREAERPAPLGTSLPRPTPQP